MKNSRLFLYLLGILFSSTVYSGIGDWTTYTNKADIRDIGIYKSNIWCATNGGAFKYNINDSTYEDFTNTNALSSNDVNAVAVDSMGNVWFGMSNGYINSYRNETKQWKVIDDIVEQKEHVIHDFALKGDSLFVGIDIGISLYHHLYSDDSSEVKETYKNLGVGFNVEVPVKSVFLHHRDIWAGTDFGVSKSNLDIPNLQAPNSWTYYTSSNSNLLSNTVRSISAKDSIVYVATDKGICKFENNDWVTVNNGLSNDSRRDVYALISRDGKLYAGTKVGVYVLESDTWVQLGDFVTNITSIDINEDGNVWVGRSKTTSSRGFAQYDQAESKWYHYIPNGPAGNSFKGLAVDHNGVLWCCSPTDGIFSFDGLTWTHYSKERSGLSNNNIWNVAVDNYNQKWFVSWGGGAIKIADDDNISVYRSDVLSGIDIDPSYVPVTNLAIDKDNNVWFIIYGAADGNIVAVTTPEGQWQYFSTNDGILTNNDKELYGIGIDQYNRAWIGSRNGVTVIDHNNTVLDKSDDDYSGTLTTTDGLISNDVRSIAKDYEGIMWLGTNMGLNYWQAGNVYAKSGVIHDNIQTIAVDVRNNKWFGTIAGLSILAPDNFTWIHYTVENSPLVSSSVTAFAFDENTGRVYIATTNGLSCLETPYAKPQLNLDNVKAGPNPFIIRSGNGFALYKLADGVSINFFTPDGIMVREVPKEMIQGYYEWDGRTDDGTFVSSGVYIYIIHNSETGLSEVGKVAVIRE